MSRLPATPGPRRHRDAELSTTPSAPPPTSFTSKTFTPAGPPSSSVLGNQNHKTDYVASNFFADSQFLDGLNTYKRPVGGTPAFKGGFAVPDSSPLPVDEHDERESDIVDQHRNISRPGDIFADILGPRSAPLASNGMKFTQSPRSPKRARDGELLRKSIIGSCSAHVLDNRTSVFPGIAKSLGTATRVKPTIEEPDAIVLATERVLTSLDQSLDNLTEVRTALATSKASADIIGSWARHTTRDSVPASIGPMQKSDFAAAAYVASLALQIHHPAMIDYTSSTNHFLPPVSDSLWARKSNVPVPMALLNWLNANHNPYSDDLSEVLHTRPSTTANDRFWDTVFSTMLRGHLAQTIDLLDSANFADAETAQEDGYDEPGYRGRQLTSAQSVVAECAQVLKMCPAYTDGDWDVKGPAWSLFRSCVLRALEDLESFAEDDSADRNDNEGVATGNVFQPSRFGNSISAASRRAESKVPWTIYQQLKVLYGQLLGRRDEIVDSAQDWLEAVLYLTIWWDGEEDSDTLIGEKSLNKRFMKSGHHTREVDVSPIIAYQRRLLISFADVTDQPQDVELGVNTLDGVQVALACVFEDDFSGLLSLLRAWSLPVAAAVVDIASTAGWMPDARHGSNAIMDGFDQDDLMVLNHDQGEQQDDNNLHRDNLMSDYASMLAKTERFAEGEQSRSGWEMAVRVLSRLDHGETAERKIGELFESMIIQDSEQIDSALMVCDELGLADQSHRIAQRYADNVAKTTRAYGEAILYYARGRCVQQLQETIELLICTSLVQSTAYPPADEIDRQLHDLLSDQRKLLIRLARVDPEAARLITKHLSGYATLRKFYSLRAEGDDLENDEQKNQTKTLATTRTGLGPRARKREAMKALLVLIQSAADKIRGGLYDANVDAVVQVDALLLLLGEVLPLLNQSQQATASRSQSVCKTPQLMILLGAIEDLQTVTPRVYEQAEAMFQAAMADYNANAGPSDQAGPDRAADNTSNKTHSMSRSLLTASSYGMINSNGSLESETSNSMLMDGSGRTRPGDWRKGIALAAGRKAKGADVLRILRVQIARDLAVVLTESPQ